MDEIAKLLGAGATKPAQTPFGTPAGSSGGATPADAALKSVMQPTQASPMVHGAKRPQVSVEQIMALLKGRGQLGG